MDYAAVMRDVLGYRGKWLIKHFSFYKHFKEAYGLSNYVRAIEATSIEYKGSELKVPASIDYIPFIARMELEALFEKPLDMQNHMNMAIAIVCFKEDTGKLFDSASKEFEEYKERVSNQPLVKMIGLYRKIEADLKASNDRWNKEFQETDSTDPDFLLAGGSALQRFNILNLITQSCADFNVPEDKAWQLSFLMVQTNALRKASTSLVQERLTKIKERKMKQKKGY